MTITALNIQDERMGGEMLRQLHKPQNALMHQKQRDSLVESVVPIITGLVEEGIELGLFSTPFPREAVEMILVYTNYAFDDMTEQSEDERQIRTMAFICHTERIIGAEPGSLVETLIPILSKNTQQ